MGRKNQQGEEEAVVKEILSTFPTFLNGTTFVAASTDPPDFIGESGGGRRVGLELTSWLNCGQVKSARGRERMRRDLLRIIEWERHPRPRNFSYAVIMPRWGKRVRKDDCRDFCGEFHEAAQAIDDDWKALRDGHWRALRPEEGFDYLAHQSDISRYPTLSKYISSIWFAESRQSNPTFPDESWITVEQDGGLYDPEHTIQALRLAVERKVSLYGERQMKARLGAHNLHRLYCSYTPIANCSRITHLFKRATG